MSKRKENVGEGDVGDLMELTPLGAGQEVGRSCLYMTFKGKTIMVREWVLAGNLFYLCRTSEIGAIGAIGAL
jgi:hypothetical protein